MTSLDQSENFAQAAIAHLDGLYGYAMSLAHNKAEAEDLVQEAYLRAALGFAHLAPDSNLKPWLYAILRNVWLNQLRHFQSGPRFVAAEEEYEEAFASSREDPFSACVAEAQHRSIEAAVTSLPRNLREVIVLREFQGLSYNDIATVLHCPAGTVMSRLGRARDRLRIALSQWNQFPMPPPVQPS